MKAGGGAFCTESPGGRRVALIGVPDNLASAAGKLPIKMLHDRVLVALRKEDGDRRSSGGILIPATAQVAKRLVWGEARGVGATCRQVKVGDQVLFSPEDQHEVEVHGEDLIILRERDVHAVAAERIEESTGLYL
jgi:chaperonin GroES